jgi:hypothetical protein
MHSFFPWVWTWQSALAVSCLCMGGLDMAIWTFPFPFFSQAILFCIGHLGTGVQRPEEKES